MNDNVMPLGSARDAGQWWARLHAPDCTPAERAAFEDWLAAAPAHVEAWLHVERADALAGELAGEGWLEAELSRSHAAARRRVRQPWVRGAWLTLAAMLVLAVGIGYRQHGREALDGQRYVSAEGERRELRLADGSVLSLAPGSEVRARFDWRRRLVEVVRGQVQFVVGRDPRRPFEVTVGEIRVHDIGTVFQVVRNGDAGAVGLLEGAVEVQGRDGASLALAPGEQVPIDVHGRLLGRQGLRSGRRARLAGRPAGIQGAAAGQPDPRDEPLFHHAAGAGRSGPRCAPGQRCVPCRRSTGARGRARTWLVVAGHAACWPDRACR
jgi:ferric-dicitrate binding protein FerR (iron transport regulator)